MVVERSPAPVGRKTRRAPDLALQLQKDRAGFEPFRGAVSFTACPNFGTQYNLIFHVAIRTARLKPGAVRSGNDAER
jgi:hypothetical protein